MGSFKLRSIFLLATTAEGEPQIQAAVNSSKNEPLAAELGRTPLAASPRALSLQAIARPAAWQRGLKSATRQFNETGSRDERFDSETRGDRACLRRFVCHDCRLEFIGDLRRCAGRLKFPATLRPRISRTP